jgi:hypothetical protein
MKGKKQGQTILLDTEPEVPDGTEVDVLLPTEWEAQRASLLSVGCCPEFGNEAEQARQEWSPPAF